MTMNISGYTVIENQKSNYTSNDMILVNFYFTIESSISILNTEFTQIIDTEMV